MMPERFVWFIWFILMSILCLTIACPSDYDQQGKSEPTLELCEQACFVYHDPDTNAISTSYKIQPVAAIGSRRSADGDGVEREIRYTYYKRVCDEGLDDDGNEVWNCCESDLWVKSRTLLEVLRINPRTLKLESASKTWGEWETNAQWENDS